MDDRGGQVGLPPHLAEAGPVDQERQDEAGDGDQGDIVEDIEGVAREVEVGPGLGVGLDDRGDEPGQGQLVVDTEEDAQAGQDQDGDDDGRLALAHLGDLARPLAEEHRVARLEERGEGEDGPEPGGDGEDRVAGLESAVEDHLLGDEPLSGQTPEMARAQTVKPNAVSGMSRRSPPSFASSVVPVLCSTEPALRNRPLLYMAWLIMWKMPPAMPTGMAVPMPRTM